MTRVYLADAKPEERSALRLLLLDLKMEVVGEAATLARMALRSREPTEEPELQRSINGSEAASLFLTIYKGVSNEQA